MKMMLKYPLVLLVAAALSGCAAKTERGSLLIVGGALEDDNKEVYGTLFQEVGTEGNLGILPTASGVPEETGPEALTFFQSASTGADVVLIDVPFTKPENAQNPEISAQIAQQNGIYFLGGDQSRILNAFRPEGSETLGYKALQQVLANDGIIAGSSAGAAMMSDPMIIWGVSEEALVVGNPNVPDRGVGTAPGMGFFPYGLTDQHFEYRGRLGRLIAALEITNQPFGYGISENRAIHVSLSNDAIKTVGTQALMLVDLSDATRTGFERRNIRISYLGDGDQVNGRTGRIKLAKGKVEYETSGAIPEVSVPEDIWERGSLNTFLQDFALSGRESVQVQDRFFTIVFTRDNKTRLVTPKDSFQREEVGFVNLRVDLIPLPTLETELEALKADIATAEESEAPAY